MEITQLPATPLVLPLGGELVRITTQRWALEPWKGEDPPELPLTWARKYKFSVNRNRSCAELAVLDHLRGDGWDGIWVSAFRPQELRSHWFPVPAVKAITETGAPLWAVKIFDRLRDANSGSLGAFFDVFAWREPDEVRFDEVKVGADDINLNQRKFVERALRLHHRLEQFTIIEVPRATASVPPSERASGLVQVCRQLE